MKITKVAYGRSIEVGGPFGRAPVGRVWFGWDIEIDPDLESEQEATSKLRLMADEREQEEKKLYYERRNEHRESVDLARRAHGSYVIRKSPIDLEEYLQHSPRNEIVWGAYATAFVFSSQEDAHNYATRREVRAWPLAEGYEIVPGPKR